MNAVQRKAPLVSFIVFLDHQSGVLIFCDDPSVEKAAHSAVSKFNEGVMVGHKMALYQILSATKVQQSHAGN